MKRTIERTRRGYEAPPGLVLPAIENDLTRRDFLVAGAAAVLLGGCGSGGESGEGTSADTRTIEHKYGSTEISGVPKRVVSAGLRDHEHLLALGVAPVGVREWYGEYPRATWPWATDELGDAEPEMVGDAATINFETVASLEPDLITGVYALTGEEYETLSEIAPTVPQSGEYVDYTMPWQEEISMIGRAVGRARKAEELVAGIEDRFAEAREKHPEFEGATAAMAQFSSPEDFYVLSPDDHKARFMSLLGFEFPEEIAEAVGGQSNILLSNERLGLLDRDVLVWFAGTPRGFPGVGELIAAVKENEIYRQLDAVREGRDVFLELPSAAIAFSSPLSLPFAIDETVPQLAAAVDGDPEMEVEEAE